MSHDELRTAIGEIITKRLPNPATGLYDGKSAIDDLIILVAEAEKRARIEELSCIQLQYGHYLARTFIGNKTLTIEDRIAHLSAEEEKRDE